jgi:hypothetical protein
MSQYVLSTMQEINDYTDDLYEALMDNDENVIQICEALIRTLRDVKRSYGENQIQSHSIGQ